MSLTTQGIFSNLIQTDTYVAQKISYVASGNGEGQPEYVGYSDPGTGAGDSSWAIKKLTYDSSQRVTDVQWANGNNEFVNEWDLRATYSYS